MTQDSARDLSDVVVLRRELLQEGFTDNQIQGLVRSGKLHRVRHGSYVDGPLWRSLDELDRHRVLVRAVLRRAHPSAVATHISSAVERRAPVWGIPLDEAHVTRTDGKSGRREAGISHHRGELAEEDVEILNGIRVSSTPRCAVEVTTMGTVEPALVTVNALMHAGHLSPARLAEEVEALKHWPGTLTATIVQRLADPRVESVAESRTLFLCWDQKLPRPELQIPVLDEFGHEFAYADFGWPQHGVFLEFDGRIKYERFRRKGESLEDYVLREKRREELICQVTGWVCIRITWQDLAHPRRTAQRIMRILASRG
jgi:hypothetical protein